MAIIKKDRENRIRFRTRGRIKERPNRRSQNQSKPLTAEEKVKLAKSVTTQLNNEYKEGGILVQKMGKKTTSRWPSLPTDLPTFDELVLGCGGMPDGRIIEIYGPESAGKTAFCLHVIGCAQRAGGLALFVDAEHALDLNHAKTLGVDVDNLIVSQPDYGEQALEVVLAFVTFDAVSGLSWLIPSPRSYQRLS